MAARRKGELIAQFIPSKTTIFVLLTNTTLESPFFFEIGEWRFGVASVCCVVQPTFDSHTLAQLRVWLPFLLAKRASVAE